MDDLFMILLFVSAVAIPVFIILSVVSYIKKDGLKGKKQIIFAGISLAVMIVSFLGVGMTVDTPESSNETDEEKVETTTKIEEEKPKEESEVEKVAAEQNANVKKETTALESKTKSEQAIKENKLEYSIEEERIDGSIWYVTLSTPLTKEQDLRKLVELTKDLAEVKKDKIDSIFVKVNIKDSIAKSYAADGKVALSNTGLAQTGLSKVNKYEFNYNVSEEHLTSKDDLKQSVEKYTAQDVLNAFQTAGLPTTDSRDNSHKCLDLECTTLITTEDVSIYEWPSVEKAEEVQAKGLGGAFGDAQIGTIIIRMNNKTLDVKPYINTLNSVVNK